MSRNTVAGGMPEVAFVSPLAAASEAALSLAAFSPSFFTSFDASEPLAVTGAGGGMTDGDGVGDRTFVSGAFAGSAFAGSPAFAGSAVLAGSVAAAFGGSATGAGTGAGTTGAGAGLEAFVSAGAVAAVTSAAGGAME